MSVPTYKEGSVGRTYFCACSCLGLDLDAFDLFGPSSAAAETNAKVIVSGRSRDTHLVEKRIAFVLPMYVRPFRPNQLHLSSDAVSRRSVMTVTRQGDVVTSSKSSLGLRMNWREKVHVPPSLQRSPNLAALKLTELLEGWWRNDANRDDTQVTHISVVNRSLSGLSRPIVFTEIGTSHDFEIALKSLTA